MPSNLDDTSSAVTSFSDPSLEWSDTPAATDPSPVETAPVETNAAPPQEGATSLPVPTDASAATPELPGPIPFERHKEILDAAYKERDDFKSRAERVAWAEELAQAGLNAEQIREAVAVRQSVDSDPVGYAERLIAAMQHHPQLASQVRSMAARVLGQRAEQADPEPQPDFQTPDGARFYSQEQQAKLMLWRERQLEQRIDQKFQPLIEARERAEADERDRAAYAAQAESAKTEFDQFKDQPYFAEHKADIVAFMQQHQWKKPLAEAYSHVLATKVIPKLTETGKAQAVADFQKQAAASSTKPSVAAPVTPVAPKSFYDPALKW